MRGIGQHTDSCWNGVRGIGQHTDSCWNGDREEANTQIAVGMG